jgi:hypothetical protein
MHARIADRRMAVEKLRREQIYRLLAGILNHLAEAAKGEDELAELDLIHHRKLLAELVQREDVPLATLGLIAAELTVHYQRFVECMLKAKRSGALVK